MADIKISSSDVSDPTKPSVKSSFLHDIPASIEEAQKRFPATMVSGKLVDPVYEMFAGQYTIAIQAPARKELIAQWESIDAEERTALIVEHKGPDGESVFTAKLPDAQQAALQERMNSWHLGERSPRQRVIYGGDPVKAFMETLPTLTEERKAEIAAQLASLLGMSVPSASQRQRR